MIAVRLVRLIEVHSEVLTEELLVKFQTSPRTADLQKVPLYELRARSSEILRHLSEWLLSKAESDIEGRYREIGALRASQNVSFSDFCWAIVLTKEHIWDFIQQHGFLQGPLEVYGAMEFLRLLDQFFERAICYAAEGYERSKTETLSYVSVSRHAATPLKRL
ncbi:MAG TPA: hypothetical protein VGG46_12770 [Terriglobales bacterium]|jgi:hypothetical protein